MSSFAVPRAALPLIGKLASALLIATVSLVGARAGRAEQATRAPQPVVTIDDQPAAPPVVTGYDIEFENISHSYSQPSGGGGCTPEKIQAANAAAAKARPFHGCFWAIDYSYLYNPCYTECFYSDLLKQNCLGGWGMLDLGGSYSMRFQREHNMRGAGLTGRDDEFLLYQTRLFANWEVTDNIRLYAEYIDATSNYEDFPPRPIEENRSDMLNIFGDFRLYSGCCGDLWFRIGRQELIYGAQRLISPLPWGFTRRNFEGGKLFWRGEDWDIDAFWTRPVYVNKTQFDSPNYDQEFSGVWATKKDAPGGAMDFYFIRFINGDAAVPFDYDTLGSRWKGQKGNYMWEAEAAVQWGHYGTDNHLAGMFTLGLGRQFPNMPGKPNAWIYYDWASGSDEIGNGFHHLFPLAHKYLGFMDLYGRRNIEDLNFLVDASVTPKIKVLAWYHVLWLQNGNDVPYNVLMQPEVATPGGSQYLGQELDLLLSWDFHPRMNMTLGYSHFFAGSFYSTNPSVPFDGDADFFYAWYTWCF